MNKKKVGKSGRGTVALLGFLAILFPAAGASGELDRPLLSQAQQAQGELLKDLEILVNIDSPSLYSPGLDKIMDILGEKLRLQGAEVKILPGMKEAHNLVATFQGNGKGKILLLAHADTVFRVGTAKKRPFRISDGRAYGPGVADDKGGIVAGLHALGILKERGFQGYARITFLINGDEEVGSPGSRGLIEKLARDHHFALCLEGGRAGDGLVNWRKGTGRVTVEVSGRASHAGNAPERGANALLELAHQVLQLRKLENQEKGTSLNFTRFRSGDKLNVIPDSAVAQADMRVRDGKEFDRVEKEGLEMVKNKLILDTEAKFTLSRGRPPFPRNDQAEPFFAQAQEIYGEMGLTLRIGGSGGGSDGNYTAFAGTPTIDGLGLVGGNGHTAEEYIQIGSVSPRLYLLTRLLMTLGTPK